MCAEVVVTTGAPWNCGSSSWAKMPRWARGSNHEALPNCPRTFLLRSSLSLQVWWCCLFSHTSDPAPQQNDSWAQTVVPGKVPVKSYGHELPWFPLTCICDVPPIMWPNFDQLNKIINEPIVFHDGNVLKQPYCIHSYTQLLECHNEQVINFPVLKWAQVPEAVSSTLKILKWSFTLNYFPQNLH